MGIFRWVNKFLRSKQELFEKINEKDQHGGHIMDYSKELLGELNREQKKAVLETEGYVCTIAGAGTGKTRVLVHRYAYITKCLGISPANVLCVTFTNKAAGEMKKRIRGIAGEGYDNALITTYHGFCVRVLREDIHHLKFPQNFLIIDQSDQKEILREIFEEQGMTLSDSTFKKESEKISQLKSSTCYVDKLIGVADEYSEHFLADSDEENSANSREQGQAEGNLFDSDAIFHRYLAKQKKAYALDFDDLINFVLVIFSRFEDVLYKWQKKLHYVQVDEFQDTSQREFTLISQLVKLNKNLFVVGDPDQTIYEWRGAKPGFLVDFDKIYPNCKTFILSRNYRSTPQILNVGNSLIAHNMARVPKDLYTINFNGPKAIHYHAPNEEKEMNWVVNEITKLKENSKVKNSDFAILYRANYQSRNIEQVLVRANIDYTIYSGTQFYQRKEIKDAIAYLQMVANGSDMFFKRVVNLPSRGIGKKRMAFLQDKADQEKKTLYETLQEYLNHHLFQETRAKEFVGLIEKYRVPKEEKVSDILQGLLNESGYERLLQNDGDQERLDNLAELKRSVIIYEKEAKEKVSLQEYLEQVALYTNLDLVSKRDTVKLMTLHASKGLEFPYVFIIGLTDGVVPNYRSLEQNQNWALEEERRLLYVGITRAKRALNLSDSEIQGDGRVNVPSRFLSEIADEEIIRLGKKFTKAENNARNCGTSYRCRGDSYQIGDQVEHPVFGKGEIKEIDRQHNTYIIFFYSLQSAKPINISFIEALK